jgi:hypothetical protein
MQTFLATLALFAAVMALMAIGAILQGRRLKGSCGGSGGDCPCDEAAQRECALKKEAR